MNRTTAALVLLTVSAITATALAGGHSTQVYDGPGWVRYGCTTYPLNPSSKPSGKGTQDPAVVYDPALAWDATPTESGFRGYEWLKSGCTDSAAAITAMATGQKTYVGAINWSDKDEAIKPTIVEWARSVGKATGTISTVWWSHATPAGMSNAHNVKRGNYEAIANEMLNGDVLDVIMGCGNPGFDNDGHPAERDPKYVGGADTWAQLKAGTHPGRWQLRQTLAEFQALTTGDPTGHFLGCPQVSDTLQGRRTPTADWNGDGKIDGDDARSSPVHDPSRGSQGDPLNEGVPTLALMTRGALNILDADEDGFFLLIEGGAVDWANHARQPARMIEEQMDFNRAVEAVCKWVETHSNWDETLVIVTSDHDCGMVWGPNADTVPFDDIVDQGEGHLPGMRHYSGGHTHCLVPFYIRGAGAAAAAKLLDGTDETARVHWGIDRYLDNTDIFTIMRNSGARNIILMISDGASLNVFNAASMWEGRWVR
ncbi:MAG: alkaline phosphatase [Phycisphaerae bacterium]